MSIRMQALIVDTTDPDPIARFWAEVLGWRRTYASPDEIVLEPPAGSPEDGVAPDLLFLRVSEGSRLRVLTYSHDRDPTRPWR